MAIDYSILVQADESEISVGTLAELSQRLIAALQEYSPTYTHDATYAASGTDNVTIAVGKGGTVTVDWGFRITVDNTSINRTTKMAILQKVLAAIRSLTTDTITFAVTYAAGTPTHQFNAAIA